jgi:hypothetical protein
LPKIESLEIFSAVSDFRYLDEKISAETALDADLDFSFKETEVFKLVWYCIAGILGTTMLGTDQRSVSETAI